MNVFKSRLMLPFAIVAVILVATTPADAAKINNKSKGNGTNTSSLFSTQVAELNTTIKLLQAADHDYQGHRAQAIHDIHQAIHALHPTAKNNKSSTKGKQVAGKNNIAKGKNLAKKPSVIGKNLAKKPSVKGKNLAKKPSVKGKNSAKGKGANKEPQAVSDAQLKQAISQLNTVRGQLKAAPPAALKSIQAAVKQLQVALTIK